MKEPVVRLFISPKGVLKVDALIERDEQRDPSYEFCHNIFGLIRDLDHRLRESVQAS